MSIALPPYPNPVVPILWYLNSLLFAVFVNSFILQALKTNIKKNFFKKLLLVFLLVNAIALVYWLGKNMIDSYNVFGTPFERLVLVLVIFFLLPANYVLLAVPALVFYIKKELFRNKIFFIIVFLLSCLVLIFNLLMVAFGALHYWGPY